MTLSVFYEGRHLCFQSCAVNDTCFSYRTSLFTRLVASAICVRTLWAFLTMSFSYHRPLITRSMIHPSPTTVASALQRCRQNTGLSIRLGEIRKEKKSARSTTRNLVRHCAQAGRSCFFFLFLFLSVLVFGVVCWQILFLLLSSDLSTVVCGRSISAHVFEFVASKFW